MFDFDSRPSPAFSPCMAHIDLGRLRRNLRRLSPCVTAVMPVIKGDAYGHGLLPVASVLAEEGVRHFAVGTVDEACFLRDAGFNQCLVPLLGALDEEGVARAVAARAAPLVHNRETLQSAAAYASLDEPVDIVLKCETGMSRLGFRPQDLPSVVEYVRAQPQLRPVLALSHLACADMPHMDAATRQQGAVFAEMCATLQSAFPRLRTSLCNSAGSLAYHDMGGDLLRPGLAIYGGNPLHGTAWAHLGAELEEVMSVSTTILQVQDVQAGQCVSYGATFTATRPMRLAVLGVGYADGYTRSLSSRGAVAIAGQRAPVCGRVCMGMLMVDVTHIPEARVGHTAWLAGGEGPLSLQSLADQWGTIIYEVQCLLGRNRRVYFES